MTRLTRRIAGLAAIAAMLFSQLAVSAYACPRELGASQASVAIAGTMDGCDEAVTANLCDRHCDYGASATGHVSIDGSPGPAFACVVRAVEPPAAPGSTGRAVEHRFLLGHSPPPLTLFGALRI